MSLHDDEVVSTPELVRRLVTDQFPQWAHLPVTPGPVGGTDHHLFRLGDELLVRMPKIAWAQHQAVSDARWLPRLAPHLPLQVPAPEAVGEPGLDFPFRWSVTPWLDGASPAVGELGPDAARQLGEFVAALRTVSTEGGPVKDGTGRGVPLARLDDEVRAAITESGTRIDARAVTKAWDQALGARPASDVFWIHGDLLPGNLLAHDGSMTAVIDWGGVGVGDPAADLIPSWTQFAGEERAAFRAAATDGLTDPDDAWERGRGWVLVQAVIALPYYWDRWPAFARGSQQRIAAVLKD
jgi:aminoglycoside phosphotransferase (APT) family kinase protein